MFSSRLWLLLGLLGFVTCHFAIDRNSQSFNEGSLASDGSEIIADAFLDAIRLSIVASDEETLGSLIADELVYKGCKSNYNKTQTIEYLLSLPKSDLPYFKHQSPRFVNENADVEFTMAPFVPESAKTGKFVLHNRDGRFVLANGNSLDCDKEFIESEDEHRGFLSFDMQSEAADAVIDALTKAINSDDLVAIGSVFTHDFRLQMCVLSLEKQTMVNYLSQFLTGREFNFKVISTAARLPSDDISAHIVLTSPVLNFDADYILRKKNGVYQIAHGQIRYCA